MVFAVGVLAAACGSDGEPVLASGPTPSPAPATETLGDVVDSGPDQDVPVADLGPIGGGKASGTGADVTLQCPPDVGTLETDWYGPGQYREARAVREGFGDFVQDPDAAPVQLEAGDGWSTWVRYDDDGSLVAYVTIVDTGDGWDPSHGAYCEIVAPAPVPPPFTLNVSNQSFEDPAVFVTVVLDGEVIVDQNFDVEGQHTWVVFEVDLAPGTHVITATSSTGVEFSEEFVTVADEPRWAVLNYWFDLDEGGRFFDFTVTDEPGGFA